MLALLATMSPGAAGLTGFVVGLVAGLVCGAIAVLCWVGERSDQGHALALVVALAVLLSCPGAWAAPPSPRSGRPTLHLRVWPGYTGMAPATFEARAIFRDPGKVATCPAWRISWDEESASEWEETSCDPYARAALHPDEYRPPRRRHTFRTGGEFRVEVEVRGGDRRKAYRASRTVIVAGPTLEQLR